MPPLWVIKGKRLRMMVKEQQRLVLDSQKQKTEKTKSAFLTKKALKTGRENYELDRAMLRSPPVWPDWVICCTLGNFSKLVAIIILPAFLGKFCKVVEIFHFAREIIFGQVL